MSNQDRARQRDIPRQAEQAREREEERGVPRGDHDPEAARDRAGQPGAPADADRGSKES